MGANGQNGQVQGFTLPSASAIIDRAAWKTNLLSGQFTKPKLKLFQARIVALGIGLSFSLAAAAADSAGLAPAEPSQAIPWSQLGAKAGTDYQGDGVAVSPTAEGARLRCGLQLIPREA